MASPQQVKPLSPKPYLLSRDTYLEKMATRLNKQVARKCISAGERGRLFVVAVCPGDLVGVRLERTRRTEYMSIDAIYHFAVKSRVAAEKAAKKKAKANR
jgi:hypothetical protein